LQSTDESLVPLTVNCWPTPGGGGTTVVNLEYELQRTDFALVNVCITIPIPGEAPVVGEADGTYEFDVKNHAMNWKLDLVDHSNPTGAMEFTMKGGGNIPLLPINISFTSRVTFCNVEVDQVVQQSGPVKYSFSRILQTESYQVA